MTLSCSYGELRSLYGYGLTKDGAAKCETAETDLDFIDVDCRDGGLFESGSGETFASFFEENCVGKSDCLVPVETAFPVKSLADGCKSRARERIRNRQTAWVIAAACQSDAITFEALGYEYPKERLGLLVVALDLLAVVAILLFVKIIKMR